jgi:ribonuclease HI
MSATLTSEKPAEVLSRVFVYADLQMTESGVYGWRFIVEAMDGGNSIEASDVEPGTDGERLELLAVLRALESLEEPSHVLLLTPSQYVIRGIRYGLSAWRESAWRWERFGRMVPVKNADLWERIDRALSYHQVQCRRGAVRVLRERQIDSESNSEAGHAEKSREPILVAG